MTSPACFIGRFSRQQGVLHDPAADSACGSDAAQMVRLNGRHCYRTSLTRLAAPWPRADRACRNSPSAMARLAQRANGLCRRKGLLDLCARKWGNGFGHNIAIERPVPVLAGYGRIPHLIVGCEPADQQIVVELRCRLPVRTYFVKGLQRQRPQRSLRRERWSGARVQLVEVPRQRRQRCFDQRAESCAADDWQECVSPAHIAQQPAPKEPGLCSCRATFSEVC